MSTSSNSFVLCRVQGLITEKVYEKILHDVLRARVKKVKKFILFLDSEGSEDSYWASQAYNEITQLNKEGILTIAYGYTVLSAAMLLFCSCKVRIGHVKKTKGLFHQASVATENSDENSEKLSLDQKLFESQFLGAISLVIGIPQHRLIELAQKGEIIECEVMFLLNILTIQGRT